MKIYMQDLREEYCMWVKFQGTTEPQQKLPQGLKLGGDIVTGWVHCEERENLSLFKTNQGLAREALMIKSVNRWEK